MDISKLSNQELKNYFANNQKHNMKEAVVTALIELQKRGIAKSKDYAVLDWNLNRVRNALDPFKLIAQQVSGNQRTSYTEAGGKRIGRGKDDPEHYWVDAYSAIKTNKINAVFVCYIKRVGDDPRFELKIDEKVPQIFHAEELELGLKEWSKIAEYSKND